MADDPGANRIQFDIPVARQDVPGRFDQAGLVPALPQAAGSLMLSIEVMGIALRQHVHQCRASCGATRRQEQMHVIAHEAVGVNGATGLLRDIAQQSQVNKMIAFLPKTDHAIVAALNNVDGKVRHDQAWLARHNVDNGAGVRLVDEQQV
jgi:hypothetical protein